MTPALIPVNAHPSPPSSNQYRVDSRISPSDIIYEPASYSRLREQVRDVKGKMDVEKQLLDRYLGNDPSSLRKYAKAKNSQMLLIAV